MRALELTSDAHVLVLTGAGVSAESGVPTFRGLNGLWEGRRVEEVASPEAFAEAPDVVWRFYTQRRSAAMKVHPNPGHHALARLETRLGERFLLATQNVDGLHARAGSRRMLAIHGELFESRCVRCALPFEDLRDDFSSGLPQCERCGAPVRPNIVWFGEALNPAHLDQVGDFISKASKSLVFLAIGTSGAVFPAAGIVDEVRRAGGQSWLIDAAPSDSYAARFDTVIRGKSGEVLPLLLGDSKRD